MTDDAELLRCYAEERSEEAFAELVRRHLGLVYAVALRKVGGDAHLAQDVAQGVFTDLARKAAALSQRAVLTGWLFTSTHYAAAKAVRSAQRRRTHEQEAQLMRELTSDSTSAIDWERLRPVLDDLIDELDERDREAVLLRFFEGREFAQVGAKLNLSTDGARSRTERAVEKIRASLVRRGVTSTAAAVGFALANQVGASAPMGLAANVTSTALAGAAAAGISTFMSMTKLIIGISTALAVAGIAGLVIQQRMNGQLRDEIAKLRQQNQAIANLRAQNELLTKTVNESAYEVTSLLNAIESLRVAQKSAGEQTNAGAVVLSGQPSNSAMMLGAVNKPGPVVFPDQQEFSLVEAIVRAGGFTRIADSKHVAVKRTNADGTIRIDVVDVQKMMTGASGDIIHLQPKDVVVVYERTR
jgi:RNA polymerase sigma factor (sigma-70 family)